MCCCTTVVLSQGTGSGVLGSFGINSYRGFPNPTYPQGLCVSFGGFARSNVCRKVPPCWVQNLVDYVWNVMAHAQPDSVFRRNGRVHLNRQGRQVSRLLAAEVCPSAVAMLDTPCSEVVWRVLATHSNRSFPFTSPPVRHRVPSHFNWTQAAIVASLTPLSAVLPVAAPAVRFPRAVCKNEIRTWYRPASITYGCLIASI